LVFRSQNTDEELKELSKTNNPEEIDIGEEDDEEEMIEGERKTVECADLNKTRHLLTSSAPKCSQQFKQYIFTSVKY